MTFVSVTKENAYFWNRGSASRDGSSATEKNAAAEVASDPETVHALGENAA